MPFVRFLEQRDVMAQGQVVDSFKMGQVYELPQASCERWIRRGAAVACGKPKVKPASSKPAVKSKPKAKTKPKPKAKPITDYSLPGKVDRGGIVKRTEG